MSNPIKNPVIGIVDNDASILDALALVLEELGYQVEGFSTGARFLEYADSQPVDLVFLDPHLPGQNGKDVFLCLGNSIPTIILTASPNAPLTRELLELGATELIIKPASLETLQRVLEKHLCP